ncbi:MAG: pyridoxamine 5'-phosphate oxidase family protein [Anaerotignum sp.]|nr:pyridoxamine 5'-phosphate oxidase family protein [Anaerotignum sp.]
MKQGHPMRRKDRLVSEERAREIMAKAEYGIFITADREGQPYGIAVSHVAEGDKIYFHCAADVGRKLDNIKANNKVCMNFTCNTFVDHENYTHRYESVVAEGIATIVEDREEKYHALQLVAKKYAPHSFKDSDDYILPKMDITGVVRIDIETMSGKVNER